MKRDKEKGVWNLETFLEVFSYKTQNFLKGCFVSQFYLVFQYIFLPNIWSDELSENKCNQSEGKVSLYSPVSGLSSVIVMFKSSIDTHAFLLDCEDSGVHASTTFTP